MLCIWTEFGEKESRQISL